MGESILQLRQIRKSFDNTEVLKGIDLEVAQGEFITLLGASGCGKTTTLRIIEGLDLPDAGQVILEGQDITNREPNKRDVNTVFQNYALFPNMTVRENIAFAFGKEKEKDFLEELLERFYLTEVAELYPSVLSGGQQQRTAMARMLAAKPDVILLDEPFSALDSFLRQEMEREVQQVLQSFGGVSILVSHNKEEIFRLTQKCMVMERGKIAEIGDTKEIFAHPKTAEGRLLIQGGSL